MLKMMYCGSVEITVDNVLAILDVSVRFDVAPLVQFSVQFLQSHTSSEHACWMLDVGVQYGLVKLVDRYSDEGIETLSRLVRQVLSQMELCLHDTRVSVLAHPEQPLLRARLSSVVVLSSEGAAGGLEARSAHVAGLNLALAATGGSGQRMAGATGGNWSFPREGVERSRSLLPEQIEAPAIPGEARREPMESGCPADPLFFSPLRAWGGSRSEVRDWSSDPGIEVSGHVSGALEPMD
ncbi:unnamed protein product [Prorocentrum cordatum]|uniref:Uncharacterized protein n=1 Tax=Prorocentrum cordatum TaxID=2364126 RepID=A0ABN9PQS4_9DINO|nr:unnamed protein product [Polarella glacialis]